MRHAARAFVFMVCSCGFCFGDIDSGLVGWWKFDGDASDSAEWRNGVLSGGPVYAEGKVGQCLDFDGVDDYATVDYSPELNANTFSVACWVKVEGGAGTERTIVSSQQTEEDFEGEAYSGYALGISASNKWQFTFAVGEEIVFPPSQSSRWEQLESSADVLLDTWTHVAVTFRTRSSYDPKIEEIRIYVDGVQAGWYGDREEFVANTSGPLRFGAGSGKEHYPPINLFDGQLDDVRIYNRVLEESEFAEFMDLAMPLDSPDPPDGAFNVDINADLAWSDPGGEPFLYDKDYLVYFGTDDPPTEVVGFHHYWDMRHVLGTLEYETTYYWKVDKIADFGTVAGAVWSFETGGDKATAPGPGNGAAPVEIDVDLSWTGYENALSHTVYFGTDNPPTAVLAEETAETTIDLNTLDYATTYYWRVDENISTGTGKVTGDVWSFTTRYEDGRTLSVDDDGPAMFSKIQAAIDVAGNGYTIIVKKGRYVGNLNMRGKAITLRSSDPLDSSVVVKTIIDGGQTGSVIKCVSGEGANTVIDGFVITNGRGTHIQHYGGYCGGGMLNIASSPTVTNCIFTRNKVDAGSGGGMYNRESSPTVSNCLFAANWSTTGSGMENVLSNPTVINCTFSGNTATYAGAMVNWWSSPTVINCRFIANAGGAYPWERATGMGNMDSSVPKIVDSCFCENSAQAIAGDWTDGGGNNLEFCPPPKPIIEGDVNGDGKVDMRDLALLAEHWLEGTD